MLCVYITWLATSLDLIGKYCTAGIFNFRGKSEKALRINYHGFKFVTAIQSRGVALHKQRCNRYMLNLACYFPCNEDTSAETLDAISQMTSYCYLLTLLTVGHADTVFSATLIIYSLAA